jgi:hypothetical protein
MIVFLLGAAGIALSIFGSNTCEFFSYTNVNGTAAAAGMDPPFDQAVTTGFVGIYNYRIVHSESSSTSGDCIAYDDTYGSLADTYPSISAAQFCALIAPMVAGLAILVMFMELVLCGFYGSFMLVSSLCMSAAGIQAGTFGLIADPVFW